MEIKKKLTVKVLLQSELIELLNFFFTGRSWYLEFNSLGSSCIHCIQCIYVGIVVLCQYEGTRIYSLQQSRIWHGLETGKLSGDSKFFCHSCCCCYYFHSTFSVTSPLFAAIALWSLSQTWRKSWDEECGSKCRLCWGWLDVCRNLRLLTYFSMFVHLVLKCKYSTY